MPCGTHRVWFRAGWVVTQWPPDKRGSRYEAVQKQGPRAVRGPIAAVCRLHSVETY